MDTPPKVIGIAPQLVVPDVKKTAAYYRDVLGFTIRSRINRERVK